MLKVQNYELQISAFYNTLLSSVLYLTWEIGNLFVFKGKGELPQRDQVTPPCFSL